MSVETTPGQVTLATIRDNQDTQLRALREDEWRTGGVRYLLGGAYQYRAAEDAMRQYSLAARVDVLTSLVEQGERLEGLYDHELIFPGEALSLVADPAEVRRLNEHQLTPLMIPGVTLQEGEQHPLERILPPEYVHAPLEGEYTEPHVLYVGKQPTHPHFADPSLRETAHIPLAETEERLTRLGSGILRVRGFGSQGIIAPVTVIEAGLIQASGGIGKDTKEVITGIPVGSDRLVVDFRGNKTTLSQHNPRDNGIPPILAIRPQQRSSAPRAGC